MGDWLKDRPFMAWLLNLLSAVLIVFIGFWAYGFRDSNSADEARIKRLEDQKAEITSVDKHYELIQEQLDKKADKSLVESMDSKLDLILQRLK